VPAQFRTQRPARAPVHRWRRAAAAAPACRELGSDIEVDWPGPSFPATGSAVPRTELDKRIRPLAATTGASILLASKVVDIKHDSCGRVSSLVISRNDGHIEVGCGELLVADGARSPLGRTLGRQWHQQTVYGVAVRGYLASPRSHEP